MDAAVLNPAPAEGQPSSAGSCPRCEEDWSRLPRLRLRELDGLEACRCQRCGTRGAWNESSQGRWLFSCNGCGIPFEEQSWLAPEDQRCVDCQQGNPPEQTEARWMDAIEEEIVATVAGALDALDDSALDAYLMRTARAVAGAMNFPSPPRIDVLNEDELRILTLPSGRIWISRGLVSALRDESQLAFLLAHEMAHAAAGDALARWIRLGLIPLIRDGIDEDTVREAVVDLSCLGYGRRRERDADDAALRALRVLGYDPESTWRLLDTLQERYSCGDASIAEYVFAHPPARDRRVRMEITAHTCPADGRQLRTNGEVFHRVAHGALQGSPGTRSLHAEPVSFASGEGSVPESGPRWVWLALGVVALTAAIFATARVLAGG